MRLSFLALVDIWIHTQLMWTIQKPDANDLIIMTVNWNFLNKYYIEISYGNSPLSTVYGELKWLHQSRQIVCCTRLQVYACMHVYIQFHLKRQCALILCASCDSFSWRQHQETTAKKGRMCKHSLEIIEEKQQLEHKIWAASV